MGAWAEDTFGNDTACDWIYEFLDNPGLEAIQDALDTALDEDEDCLDSDYACEALAACEVIAAWQGHWPDQTSYNEELTAWIKANPTSVPPELKAKALAAIDRILGPNSELLDLWDDGARNDTWHAAIDDLRRRCQ